MTRSLFLVLTAALVAPALAAALDLAPELELRLQRLAEQRVLEALQTRAHEAAHPGQEARICGSAVIDADHVQVDLYYVTRGEQSPVAGSDERFLYTVSEDHIQSLGRPMSEIAILPHGKGAEDKAKADALARFRKSHPEIPDITDGTQPMVRDVKRDMATGQINVVCESFGGIAAIWMGDAVRYTYSRDGKFVGETNL